MPQLRALLFALLTFVLPLTAAAETISGVVADADHGNHLAGMVVAAYNGTGSVATTKTDSSGGYSLNVQPGTYRVLAWDDNLAYAVGYSGDAPSYEESPVTILTTGQSAVVNLVLHVGGKVSGNVTTSGAPAAGMTVAAYNLSGTRRGLTTTDSTGAYTIVLPPGTYKMVAYDDAGAFAPSFFNQSQTFAAAAPVTVVAQTTIGSVSFFLQIGARLLGVVMDTTQGPVANAVVIAFNTDGVQIAFAITAANGIFTMTVPPGTYRLVAVDPAFVHAAGFLSGANSFDTSPALALNGGQVRTDLVFRLERGGNVTGVVTDAATGAGLRNITVAAYNNDGTQRTFVTTDANGKYVLLLPSGSFRIAAFDSNLVYATQFYPQSTNFGHATAITASPGQTVTLQPLTLSHGGHFHGTVTDQATRATVAGAIVSAYDDAGNLITSATSGLDGTYSLVVPPGAYRLIVYDPQLRYAPAYAGGVVTFSAIKPVAVSIDGNAPVSFAVQRGTTVTGTVVDRLRAPVSDVVVTALDLNENPIATSISSSDGTFKFSLVPGQYKFVAIDPNGRYGIVYMGGSSFASATIVTVDAAAAPPRLIVMVAAPAKRRAVHQ